MNISLRTPNKIFWKGAIVLLWAVACLCALGYHSVRSTDRKSLTISSKPAALKLSNLVAGRLYAITVSLKDPALVGTNTEVRVRVEDAQGLIAEKILHAGDLDFYVTIRPRASGTGAVRIDRLNGGSATHLPIRVDYQAIQPSSHSNVVIAAQPNGTWREAQSFELGQTIFGTADERPYIAAPSEDVYQALLKGFQWFKFTYTGSEPRLVYFIIDTLDRDVPMDVDVFQIAQKPSGEPDVVPYKEGGYVYQPEATMTFPGFYKFRTRVVKPGQTYYMRVAADHPAYQLRTFDYPIPPYDDPRQAVRTGMDFLINMGDSWHANTPRRGGIALRNSMPHAETQLCIACHPTQFPTRAYLMGVQNGYPVTQRHALKFLTERIYNNPRPLYGHEGANWVRVIYSARTVASRLPYLMHLFETLVSHEPSRPNFNEGYGRFLNIHYAEVAKLPGEEADGCSPSVSPFEIAAQSWQTLNHLYEQTKQREWLQERDRVEALSVPAKVENIIDLNWKIATLSIVDRDKYKKEIDALIDRLYGYQRENGQWPYKFEPDGKPSDFITFHAIWALAMAGRRPETDPKLAKSVQYCLKAQRVEGSWQGDPVYKGFNTPFRDTQFAVMALSHLYKGPGGGGWSAAFPPAPADVHTDTLDRFLSEADQYWETPGEAVLSKLRQAVTSHDQPLAREAAAAALGRVADADAVGALVKALGDPTKVVQRSAAWALREIAVRRHRGWAELAAALSSTDARTRWGATRLFNQHFRDLTGDTNLLGALIKRLDDPVPAVRYHAAAGLWRWSYWQEDNPERRGRILESLVAHMGREEHPWVRRGLIESIYNVLDENTGYLQAWIKATAREEDRKKIRDGYEAVARQQAQILARALLNGDRLLRDGVLTALWDFHVRHMAVPDKKTLTVGLPAVFTQYVAGLPDLHRPGYEYPPYREAANFHYDVSNGFQQVRIGNDSELIHFFASSGPELETALITCLQGADSPLKINVLKAGSTLAEAGGDRFALAVLRLSLDPDPTVRETVRYVYEKGGRGALNFKTTAQGSEILETIIEILTQRQPEGLTVVLPMLATLEPSSPWTHDARLVNSLKALLKTELPSTLYADALLATAPFEAILSDASAQQIIFERVSGEGDVANAALRLILWRLVQQPELEPQIEATFRKVDSKLRRLLMEELKNNKGLTAARGRPAAALGPDSVKYFAQSSKSQEDIVKDTVDVPVVFRTVVRSLDDKDQGVRAAALDLVGQNKALQRKPEIRQALAVLSQDKNLRLKKLASTILAGGDVRTAFEKNSAAELLDFEFFKERVQPILAKPGADGKACVICHSSHAVLRLEPPDEGGQFSEKMTRENYEYATKVVNIAQPEKSLILIKPTRPTDGVGNVGDYLATHNGGQRWPGNESSPEYQTILQWIRGARMESADKSDR